MKYRKISLIISQVLCFIAFIYFSHKGVSESDLQYLIPLIFLLLANLFSKIEESE